MSGTRVQFDLGELKRTFAKLIKRMTNVQPLLHQIGNAMVRTTKQRFAAGVDPEGRPWAPNSPVTVERYLLAKRGAQTRRKGERKLRPVTPKQLARAMARKRPVMVTAGSALAFGDEARANRLSATPAQKLTGVAWATTGDMEIAVARREPDAAPDRSTATFPRSPIGFVDGSASVASPPAAEAPQAAFSERAVQAPEPRTGQRPLDVDRPADETSNISEEAERALRSNAPESHGTALSRLAFSESPALRSALAARCRGGNATLCGAASVGVWEGTIEPRPGKGAWSVKLMHSGFDIRIEYTSEEGKRIECINYWVLTSQSKANVFEYAELAVIEKSS